LGPNPPAVISIDIATCARTTSWSPQFLCGASQTTKWNVIEQKASREILREISYRKSIAAEMSVTSPEILSVALNASHFRDH
jgi:hypothetical protein